MTHAISFPRFGQQIRCIGHAFDADGNSRINFAKLDGLAHQLEGFHAGAALLVNSISIPFEGHAALELNLPSGIALGAAFVYHPAGDFLHLRRGQTGLAESPIDSCHSKVYGTHILELAHIIADGRPYPGNDYHFLHSDTPFSVEVNYLIISNLQLSCQLSLLTKATFHLLTARTKWIRCIFFYTFVSRLMVTVYFPVEDCPLPWKKAPR